MDYERLIALNRYTREDILEFTGIYPEKPSVICVGNTMARKKLENNIANRIPTVIRGYGKYTAVLEICDRFLLLHKDCLDDELFGHAPFVRTDTIFIIVNPPKKPSTLLQQYINGRTPIIILDSNNVVSYCDEVVNLRQVTSIDRQEYKKLKGYPMIEYDSNEFIQREEQQVARHLRSGNVFPLPIHTHRWIARAFPSNQKILEICLLAEKTDNPVYYHGLLSLIRYKKSIKLVFPKWVKRK